MILRERYFLLVRICVCFCQAPAVLPTQDHFKLRVLPAEFQATECLCVSEPKPCICRLQIRNTWERLCSPHSESTLKRQNTPAGFLLWYHFLSPLVLSCPLVSASTGPVLCPAATGDDSRGIPATLLPTSEAFFSLYSLLQLVTPSGHPACLSPKIVLKLYPALPGVLYRGG